MRKKDNLGLYYLGWLLGMLISTGVVASIPSLLGSRLAALVISALRTVGY